MRRSEHDEKPDQMTHDEQSWSHGDDAPSTSCPVPPSCSLPPGVVAAPLFLGPLPLTLREVERQHIQRVLAMVKGRRDRAASLLGISRWSLVRRMRKLGMQSR
jgi:DNA-binding NtrC family response regulator